MFLSLPLVGRVARQGRVGVGATRHPKTLLEYTKKI